MGGRGLVCGARRRREAQVLLPLHVPVPERPPAHGPRPQLHDRRRARRATCACRDTTCCSPWAGTRSVCRRRTPRSRTASPPAKWTYDNIAYMKGQLQSLGFGIDWSRELATCDPDYYRWNQWLFLRMLERGIAYKTTGTVNWDPVDQTVLANEQVIDGRGWRTGALVEKREIPMYYLRITQYAEELLARARPAPGLAGSRAHDAGELDRPQRGRESRVPVRHRRQARRAQGLHDARRHAHGRDVRRRRRRAPARASSRRERDAKLRAFVDECRRGSIMEADLATLEKKGVATGLSRAASGHRRGSSRSGSATTSLMAYGEGAVMGVPGHDERDFAFAKKYGLPILPVIDVAGKPYSTDAWQAMVLRSTDAASTRAHTTASTSTRPTDAIATDLEAQGLGRKQVRLAAARLGHLAPALLGLPDPDHSLPRSAATCPCRTTSSRCGCPRTSCRTAPATRSRSRRRSSSASAPSAAPRRGARRTRWTRSSIRPGTFSASPPRATTARWWTSARPTGCRWTSTSAASSTRSCTCSIRASGLRVMRDCGLTDLDEPFQRLLTQGMVLNEIWFAQARDRVASCTTNPAEIEAGGEGDARRAC